MAGFSEIICALALNCSADPDREKGECTWVEEILTLELVVSSPV